MTYTNDNRKLNLRIPSYSSIEQTAGRNNKSRGSQ